MDMNVNINKKNNAGSTLVAVMVSMVFIGIVTGSFLQNAQSSSTSTGAYGTLLTMEQTAQSGEVMTRSFFTDPNKAAARDGLVDSLLANPKAKVYFLGSPDKRRRVGDKQYVRSRLYSVDTSYINDTTGKFITVFEVDVAPREKGKATRTMRAFYDVLGRDSVGVISGDDVTYGGGNAFYMGNGRMVGTSMNLKVEGRATFAYAGPQVQTLNTQSGLTFEKDVYINGPMDIQHPKVIFRKQAFFKDWLRIQSNESGAYNNFQHDVALFGGNFAANGRTVDFSGNVWLGKTIAAPNGTHDYNSVIRGQSGKRLYYTKESLVFVAGSCKEAGHGTCGLHGLQAHEHRVGIASASNPKGNDMPGMVQGFTMPSGASTFTEAALMDSLEMCPFAKRKEPNLKLDISKLSGKEFFNSSEIGKGTLTGNDLTTFINNKRNDPTADKYFYPDRKDYKSFFLINMNSTVKWNGGTFNEKVVFNIPSVAATAGSPMDFNYSFYNSSSDAMTLLYAGAGNACIQNFNVAKSATNYALFRGMIYTHHDNTCDHEFNTGSGGVGADNLTIQGAAIFNGKGQGTGSTAFASHYVALTARSDDEVTSRIYQMLSCDDTPAACGGEGCPDGGSPRVHCYDGGTPNPDGKCGGKKETGGSSGLKFVTNVSPKPMGYYFY